MSDETLRLVLQATTILFSAGVAQFFIALFKRRAENRKALADARGVDATTGSVALDTANRLIVTLQGGENALRIELDKMHARQESLQQQLDDERAAHAQTADSMRRELGRVRSELARTQGDLEVERSHREELSRRLSARDDHYDPRTDSGNR